MPDPDLSPIHPGEILKEDFLKPMALSQSRLSRALHVPPRRINEIVLGKRVVTADTALRLSRFFGTTARFWMNLQADYDLRIARCRTADRIAREVRTKEDVLGPPASGIGA